MKNGGGQYGRARFLHQKTDGGTVRAAAEAVIKLLLLADGERRCLFLVKWAQRLMVASHFAQWQALVNDVNDVEPAEELLNKFLGDLAGHG